jgi:hypothetical protein
MAAGDGAGRSELVSAISLLPGIRQIGGRPDDVPAGLAVLVHYLRIDFISLNPPASAIRTNVA